MGGNIRVPIFSDDPEIFDLFTESASRRINIVKGPENVEPFGTDDWTAPVFIVDWDLGRDCVFTALNEARSMPYHVEVGVVGGEDDDLVEIGFDASIGRDEIPDITGKFIRRLELQQRYKEAISQCVSTNPLPKDPEIEIEDAIDALTEETDYETLFRVML